MGSLRRLQRRATRAITREECWVAARRKLPAYIGEGERAGRPTLLSCIDPRAGVLAFELTQRDGEQELIELFGRATREPMVGPPRSPTRIRVEESALAVALRAELGAAIPVEVGLVPMVDEMMSDLFAHLGELAAELPEPPRGYLEGAGIAPGLVRELFQSTLHRHCWRSHRARAHEPPSRANRARAIRSMRSSSG